MGINRINDRYCEFQVSSNDEKNFRDMLKPRNWDFDRFKKVLISSSKIKTYPYETPESIHLGALRKSIDDIKKRTSETGKEHGRGFFVDLVENKLIGGKITQGDSHSCYINWDKPNTPNRLKRVISLHSHPQSFSGIHLSPEDYISFLNDPELISMIMTCGNTELITLKSSQTPNNYNSKDLERLMADNSREFLSSGIKINNLIEFQKAICLENALSLYIATETNRDLSTKVNLFDN